jgi:RND family efflux transporter MFP subunit
MSKARLAAAEAQLEEHKANLAQAQAAFERHEILAKRRVMSRKALDASRKAYERALARTKRDDAKIAQRQAALHAAEFNLGSTNIVSPVDGTVVSRDANIGQRVAAGPKTPPLFLIDPAVIHINANAGGQDFGEFKPSSKVTFTIEAFPERSFAGEVTQLRPSPQIDAQAVVYDAVISAANPDLLLKPGMRAAIRVVVDWRHNVLRAPNQALRYSPGILAVPILGFTLSGVVQAIVSHREMSRLLPDDRPCSIATALALGSAASSCSYAAVALARSIFRKGANFTAAMAFEMASTNLVLELSIIMLVLLGWQITLAEFIGAPIMVVLLVFLFRMFLHRDLLEQAKEQAEKGVKGRMEGHAEMDMSVTEGGSLWQRLTSERGFTAISHYFVMDWAAVWLDWPRSSGTAGSVSAGSSRSSSPI